MIPSDDLERIKNYLEKAENPLFFFDDDNDGLCSFILCRNFSGKGAGIPIKTNPDLSAALLNRVDEHRPDYIFVLDKPIISQDFLDGVSVPVVWLDHHPVVQRERVIYFNPKLKNKNESSSTTYWAYKATGGKLWIATIGAVSDWTMPDFFDEFEKKYPDLTNNKKDPPSLLYDSKFGELCRIFSFLTKGKTSDVNKNIAAALAVKEPYDVLEQKTKEGKILFTHSAEITKKYHEILERALKVRTDGKLIVFTYSNAELSLTADLSNELLYRNPGKLILVARKKDDEMRMSFRSDSFPIEGILQKALENVEGYGGGHSHAVGANVKVKDFDKFIETIKKEISHK